MNKRQMVEALISQADFGGGYATMPMHVWESIVLFLRASAGSRTRQLSTRIGGDLARECPAYTPREQQIAKLVCDGLSDRQIGQRLGITSGTVKVMLKKARLRYMAYQVGHKEVA